MLNLIQLAHSLTSTVSFILRHPLNRTRKAAALGRFVRWQLGSRIALGSVAVPFVDSTRLLVRPGMTGATQNVYCGLQEFEEMGFVLHALRPGDLFVDVGANIGSYTILAAGASGANCVSFEPSPATFVHLLDNIRLNNLASKVTAKNVVVGASVGSVTFTAGLDTMNHVAAEREVLGDTIDVRVEPLDLALGASAVTLLKIDVEGYETEVVKGASDVMRRDSLLAVVMELNGSGLRYGCDEEQIHQSMIRWGFEAVRYDPLQRTLTQLGSRNSANGNTLYVRNLARLRERVRTAPMHKVLGASL